MANGNPIPIKQIATLLMLLCLPLSALLAHDMDVRRGPETLANAVYIRSPRALNAMSLGQSGLAACIYWTRTVQYFGSKHHDGALRFELLEPLLILTTELDPHLTVAYEFGSIFLSQKPPEGAGMPDEAVRLVERGIERNPDNWKLYYHLGFIHYIERQDYKSAAMVFDRGSKVPGAHPWLKVMAAAMAEKGGDLDTARYFWTNVYQSSEDESIRRNALVRLLALRVDEEVILLETVVQNYRQRFGSIPASWQQMIDNRVLRNMPLDPTGTTYILKPTGRVEVFNYKRFAFIRRGLPEGEKPSEFITRENVRPDQVAPKSKVKP